MLVSHVVMPQQQHEHFPKPKTKFQNFAKFVFFWDLQWKQFEYFSRISASKNYFGFEIGTLRKFFEKICFFEKITEVFLKHGTRIHEDCLTDLLRAYRHDCRLVCCNATTQHQRRGMFLTPPKPSISCYLFLHIDKVLNSML